jgi:cold shock CspA family protein
MSEAQRHIGRIKFYNSSREFGFIRMAGGRQIFLHGTQVALAGLRPADLGPGTELEFEIITDRANRLQARNVRAVDRRETVKREDSAA